MKKANFSDTENVRLVEDVQGNYGLLMQSLKTGSVVLKKREAWTRIALLLMTAVSVMKLPQVEHIE